MYHRILVALDGSEAAEQALAHGAALAERFGSTLVLLRVTEPLDAPAALVAERREADRYLAGWYDRLTAKGLRVHYQRPEGPPAALIVEHARNQDADLIALTPQGRDGPRAPTLGSVAEAVIHAAPCPVLLVRVDRHAAGA
jgi:nucleotide-binding universal stress UspA family protein